MDTNGVLQFNGLAVIENNYMGATLSTVDCVASK